MQSNIQLSKLTQGSIAWVAYTLTDKVDKRKRRPVLIISNDALNNSDSDYIVIPITRTIRNKPFSIVIQPEDVRGELPVASELRCNKPFTVRNVLVYESICLLDQEKVDQPIALLHDSIRVEQFK